MSGHSCHELCSHEYYGKDFHREMKDNEISSLDELRDYLFNKSLKTLSFKAIDMCTVIREYRAEGRTK